MGNEGGEGMGCTSTSRRGRRGWTRTIIVAVLKQRRVARFDIGGDDIQLEQGRTPSVGPAPSQRRKDKNLVGTDVLKYFDGHGTFHGVVTAVRPRPIRHQGLRHL